MRAHLLLQTFLIAARAQPPAVAFLSGRLTGVRIGAPRFVRPAG